MSVLVTGITELVTNDPAAGDGSPLGVLRDAALVIESGRVAWIGPSAVAPAADERRDLGGRAVVPGFVDSHTHLVFAGDRAAEFEARMNGQPYDGGGIASTVAATRAASDDTLRSLLAGRVAEARAQGTTTVEVKSGYGLTAEDEARALRRDDIGVLSPGCRADLAVLDAPSHVHLAYRPGSRSPARSANDARTVTPRWPRSWVIRGSMGASGYKLVVFCSNQVAGQRGAPFEPPNKFPTRPI